MQTVGIQSIGAKLAGKDPIDLLPEAAAHRLRDLRQRERDCWALLSDPERRNELIAARNQLHNRIGWLKGSAGRDGGPGLTDESSQVLEARREMDKLAAELERIRELDEI